MTVELLKAALPKALQGNATQEWADQINAIALEPEVAEEVRNNFLSYSKVLQEGKFKTESYLEAVTYVTHKLMGYSNQDAYIRTFPARYQALVAKGATAKDISAYVSAYHKNKLVNLIMEQSMTPSWLLNQDVYQRAINTQLELMTDPDVSPKVRSDAANSILTHLKPPETQKVEIDVGVKNQGGIGDLLATMNQLAAQQRELIQGGVPARQVARQRLVIEGEVVEDVSATPRAPSNPPSLPSPSSSQPSAARSAVQSEGIPSPAPGATAASAASPPASAEGVGEGMPERGNERSSQREAAVTGTPKPTVSLFDLIPGDAE